LNIAQEKYEENLLKARPSLSKKKLVKQPSTLETASRYPKAFFKPVSLMTTESVELKDVLLTLARQAGVNISIDSNVSGGASFFANNRPFIDVMKEICRVNRLRFHYADQILRVEPDVPYLKTYNLQFLSLSRINQNRISIATDVFSAVEGRVQDIDNGSNTVVSGESRMDFWEEILENINTILMNNGYSDEESKESGYYSIHRQAGLLSVFGNDRQHQQIQKYLKLLGKAIESQVLIEAKIVEVNLSDEFKSGVNWHSLKGDFALQAPLGPIVTPGPLNPALAPTRDIFTIGASGNNLTALISFLKKFGTVRTLSNPRLTVINNQSAILKVATNRVFFKLDYTRDISFTGQREQFHVASDAKTIPIGLVMLVHPSINPENGKIIMTLRPTISRVIGEKEDPAVGIASQQQQTSLVPEVQVREFDSVISMKSGETIVLGGLMENRSDNETSGIPDVSNIPLLGGLFKGKKNDQKVTELIIFLRAVIIDPNAQLIDPETESSVSEADKNVYGVFVQDPRKAEL